MNDSEKLAVFPDIVPDSAIKTRLWVHENGDFQDEQSVSDLLAHLYDYPEDKFYLYILKIEPITPSLRAAIENGFVVITESKGPYYPHPKYKRDYVCIKEGLTRWEWQREVLSQGSMHYQHTLQLTEKARRTFEMRQLVAMQKAADSSPIRLEPNFMGIGIDLKKAYSWLRQKFKK